jgi:hypothetical protein
LVFRQHTAKEIRAQATCSESAHQHIRVEEHPHDTALFTSSSVR